MKTRKTRNLTESELQMLGLNEGTITTEIVNNADLQKYVGQFVMHKGHLGMIDDVHGNRLGFVWSDKDSWTGQLVDVTSVTVVTDSAAAKESALVYFQRETSGLKNRIGRNYSFDDQGKLNAMLAHCETWLRKLAV